MPKKSVYLVSLGCAKNTVDSESMMRLLINHGYSRTDRLDDASIILVNTCGFIQTARQESLDVLNTIATNKRDNQVLIAAGCMMERHASTTMDRIPNINGVLCTRRWVDIVELLNKIDSSNGIGTIRFDNNISTIPSYRDITPQIAIQGSSAYLKIADGCHRNCAFCSIPLIKGSTTSRPKEQILEDVKFLSGKNIKEIIILAQDTTSYGLDLGKKDGLIGLLKSITCAAPDIPWIRLMYAYPGRQTEKLLDSVNQMQQVLPYLDLPLQHAHPRILQSMKRPANIDRLINWLNRIRSTTPGLVLRSTFIVGYPGETENEFQFLLDFVRAMQFDHVGVFTYSFEAGTPSEALGDPIVEEIKLERRDRLMEIQQDISLQIHQSLVGSTLDVLIEGLDKKIAIGRSYRDAPEVDGMVIAEGRANIGDLLPVQIRKALPYDLIGKISR